MNNSVSIQISDEHKLHRSSFNGFGLLHRNSRYHLGNLIYNTNYNPRIRFDILRASIPSLPVYSAPFPSNSQEQIWVYLEDLSAHPPKTPYSSIPLRIKDVKVDRRWLDFDGGDGTTTYKSLKSLGTCCIWSWLCADIDEYPHYEFIYREDFDQYGKKGSMRHFLTRSWGNLLGLMRFWQAFVLLLLWECGALALSLCCVKGMFELYQTRMKEADDWVADDEVEGLLINDRYVGHFEEVEDEQEEAFEGKGGEKTSVERSVSAPPPYGLMEMEQSLAL